MPYVMGEDANEATIPPGDGAVLVLIHGTGLTAKIDLKAETGDRWWQPGSEFDRWLCARLEDRTGGRLSEDAVLRFVWSGENSEKAREKAAKALLTAILPIEASGRPITILAHSHGGNVARRACEIAVTDERSDPVQPWSVVCIGTPFFHYSLGLGLGKLALAVAALLIWAAALYWAPSWLAARISDWGPDWYRLVLGAVVLHYAIAFVNACSAAGIGRHRAQSRVHERAVFMNIHSPRDEAIALLRSFNKSLRIMRRQEAERWLDGPLGCAVIAFFLAWALGTVVALVGALAGLVRPSEFFQMLLLCIALVGGAVLLSFLYDLRNFVIDRIVTGRLRALAFGNDCNAAMTRVEAFPWPGTTQSAISLPPDVEEVADRYIAAHTGDLWRTLRSELLPGVPLLQQDAHALVERALTGDELVHTVYYRVEAFADLIAELFERRGQWRATSESRISADT